MPPKTLPKDSDFTETAVVFILIVVKSNQKCMKQRKTKIHCEI